MDDHGLETLKRALSASPGDLDLRLLVIRALAERDRADEAWSLASGIEPGQLSREEDRSLLSRLGLEAGDPGRALALATGDSPPLLVLQARAHLELGRTDEARRAYRAALERNKAIEDPELSALLASRVRDVAPAGDRPRLRVISRADTVASEADLLLAPSAERVTFADVGGLEEIKKQIHRRIILPFQKPGLFKKFRKRVGGGILLYGPPGCGKTLLARATAGEVDATFYNVAISDVLDMYIGESEQKLHALFEKARTTRPAVLFFDEIEALGGKRQYSRDSAASKIVSQFLSEMDGYSRNNEGVLVLGATNVPWDVDPAFRRPGRFDRVLFVPPPDREARCRILEILLEQRPVADGTDAAGLALVTSGFSGADLRNVVESAADLAIEASIDCGQEQPITGDLLRRAVKEITPTTLEWLTTARNYARYANAGGQYDEVLRFLQRHGKS